MNKNVYSLVLIDELVDEVDKEAYALGTNRSNLINQILADHFSIVTPEKRVKEIFDIVQNNIADENNFKIQTQLSDAMMSVHSPLHYKYNPTIRYGIELFKSDDNIVGELKVSFRTQNQALIDVINSFFVIWANMEKKYIEEYFPKMRVIYKIKEGKLLRQFSSPKNKKDISNEQIGNAITAYIKCLDKSIKHYINHLNDVGDAVDTIEKYYINYLNDEPILI